MLSSRLHDVRLCFRFVLSTDAALRDEMKKYWVEHSKQATEKEMMLDSSAEELGKEEVPEILAALPDVAGLDVLELGAGIG